ncbi:MAG: hypothetical protein NTZ63_02440 [Candidatus Omnitrophica bacterium]|nr:hypothetical protein [Candidatus Omnitrophota bacterium]
MKILMKGLLFLATISVFVGMVSRVTLKPIFSIEANAFLRFAALCILFVIGLAALKLAEKQ